MIYREDTEHHRFVAEDDGEIAGLIVYHIRNGKYLLVHTETRPGYPGKGVASSLVKHTLDDLRDRGEVIVPLCPYVHAWIKRHPDYWDNVDKELLEEINGAR
jgi:predicted GNAT family acetyltransferase